MIEAVVSAAMLLVVMSFVTSLLFRVDLVWRDTCSHRAAINELNNHLDYLSMLPPDELPQAIDSLQPSESVARVLDSPTLSGDISTDKLGYRITLLLDWRRPMGGKPVQMVAWSCSEEQLTVSQ